MSTKSVTPADVEALARLETKVRKLVEVVNDLRAERSALVDENTRLQVKVESLETRLAAEAESASDAEALRAEREQVRTRVASLLEQLESLDL